MVFFYKNNLKIQGIKMSYICDICNVKTTTKSNLNKHKLTESCQKIKREIENKKNIEELNEKLKKTQEEIENLKKENILLNKLNTDKDIIILNLNDKINNFQDKTEEYKKIIEKLANKSTKIINKNTYNHNNYLNYISQEPIKFSEIQNQLQKVITTKSVMFDENDFHEHIVDNILRDLNGKDKVLCTDINRKNFSYKDENSGKLVSDPELEKLREQLKNGCDIISLKKDLLNKLIKKYEDTNIDPYIKFYEMLKKLEFGNPFVEHVAKKTYIKSKSICENLNTNFDEGHSCQILDEPLCGESTDEIELIE